VLIIKLTTTKKQHKNSETEFKTTSVIKVDSEPKS